MYTYLFKMYAPTYMHVIIIFVLIYMYFVYFTHICRQIFYQEKNFDSRRLTILFLNYFYSKVFLFIESETLIVVAVQIFIHNSKSCQDVNYSVHSVWSCHFVDTCTCM